MPSKSEIPELSRRPIPKASINDVHYVATVVLQVDLSENGSICDLKIVKSAGAEFDKEALQAISRTLFQPITLEGKPIPGTMLILRDYFRGNSSNTLYAENANAANDEIPPEATIADAPPISVLLIKGKIDGNTYRNDYFGVSFTAPAATLTSPKPKENATALRLVDAISETEHRAQVYTLSLLADGISKSLDTKSQTKYVEKLAGTLQSKEVTSVRDPFPFMISDVQFMGIMLKEQDSPNTHHYRGLFTAARKGYWLTVDVSATTEERILKIASTVHLANPKE